MIPVPANTNVSYVKPPGYYPRFNGSGSGIVPIGFARNSLVCGWLGDPGWQCGAQMGTTIPSAYTEFIERDVDGAFGAVNVNPLLAPGGYFARNFQAPTSSPIGSFVLSVQVKRPLGGVAGSVTIQVTNFGQTVIFAAATITPGEDEWTTLACVPVNCAPGELFTLRVISQGVNTLVGRVAVTPEDQLFGGASFVRWNLGPGDLDDNTALGGDLLGGDWIDNFHFYTDPHSSVSFDTSASKIYIEAFNTLSQFNGGWLDIYVNGVKWAKVRPQPVGGIDIVPVLLPSGIKRVTIYQSGQIWTANQNEAFVLGTFLRAVYVKEEEFFSVVPRDGVNDTVILYGNSKQGGFYAGGTGDNLDSTAGGIVLSLRQGQTSGRVVSKAVGSRALFYDYVAGGNSVLPLARSVIVARPSHIIWEAHRNDWVGQGGAAHWASVAAWATQFAALLDFVQAALPVQQWLAYTTHETVEGANSAGQTLAQFWTAQDTIWSDRQSAGSLAYPIPPKKLDWRTLWSSANAANPLNTTDSVHPSACGYGQIAAYTKKQMGRGGT